MRIRHSAFVIALVILALASLTPLVSGVNASTKVSLQVRNLITLVLQAPAYLPSCLAHDFG